MEPLLVARVAQSTAAVVLAGTLGLRLLTVGTGLRETARWNRLAWACWGTFVAAGGGVLALTAAAMTGETLPEVLGDPSISRVLTGTHFGAVWLGRAGVLAGMFVVGLLIALSRRRRPIGLDAANGLLAAAALASLVWTGHAQASANHAWLLPVAVLHVLAAGVWPGGLLPLAVLLARARRDPTLLRATAAVTRRFSRASAVAVGVLAFSGSLNAVGIIGTFAAWWSSRYSQLLSCKVALFVGLVGLGAVNRRLVGRSGSGSAAQIVRRLAWNVGWECLLAAGVLLATEWLATSAPPGP